jgi:hypothetical protein
LPERTLIPIEKDRKIFNSINILIVDLFTKQEGYLLYLMLQTFSVHRYNRSKKLNDFRYYFEVGSQKAVLEVK